MILLLPIVPTIIPDCPMETVSLGLAETPETLCMSSVRSVTARLTPFQSDGSTYMSVAFLFSTMVKVFSAFSYITYWGSRLYPFPARD